MTSRTRLVGAVDQDGDLLGLGRRDQHARLGEDLQPHGRRGRRVVLGPFLDPVVQELEGLGVSVEPQAPLVRDLAQGLRRIRLVSGAIGLIRRPPTSCERIAKSWSGR